MSINRIIRNKDTFRQNKDTRKEEPHERRGNPAEIQQLSIYAWKRVSLSFPLTPAESSVSSVTTEIPLRIKYG